MKTGFDNSSSRKAGALGRLIGVRPGGPHELWRSFGELADDTQLVDAEGVVEALGDGGGAEDAGDVVAGGAEGEAVEEAAGVVVVDVDGLPVVVPVRREVPCAPVY